MKIRLFILALLVGLLAAIAYAQSSIKVCKAPLSGGGTVLFSADFEDNGYTTWDYVNAGDPGYAINTNMSYVHGGTHSSGVHYGFSNPPDTSQDLAMLKDFTGNGLEEWYARGYLYLKTPTGTVDILNRKLLFISDDNGSGGYNWSLFLLTFPASGANPLAFATNDNTYVLAFSYPDLFTLQYDTWYCLELRVKLDTGGSGNGIIQVWVNGTKVLDVTHAIRGSFTTGGNWFGFGKQASISSGTVNEYRYWDDIVISTGYVGP